MSKTKNLWGDKKEEEPYIEVQETRTITNAASTKPKQKERKMARSQKQRQKEHSEEFRRMQVGGVERKRKETKKEPSKWKRKMHRWR